METETQISNANSSDILEYSQEFKEEMESSICNLFNKCHLNDDQQLNKTKEIIRDNTLINNENQDVEYISPGISDFMIHQVFSTDRIIPIYESSDEESIQQKDEKEKVDENDSTTTPTNMNTCNSDETLNGEVTEILRTPEKTENETTENIQHNITISESFATEFINLLDINMKELKNKKDDFHVIGLKKIEEEKELPSVETPEVKIKEEFLDTNPKTTLKRSKHNSILHSISRRCSTSNLRLFRSKSTDFKNSSNKKQNKDSPVDSVEDDKLKRSKSKSRLSFSRLFKNVKKRISSQSLTTSKKQ